MHCILSTEKLNKIRSSDGSCNSADSLSGSDVNREIFRLDQIVSLSAHAVAFQIGAWSSFQ